MHAHMWSSTPIHAPNTCASCKQGAEVGPFWVGPVVHMQGRLGPTGLLFAPIQICHGCLFIAVNHPDSPYTGKIPKADEHEQRAVRAEAGWSATQVELAAAREQVRILLEEGATPEVVAGAAVRAAIAELSERGLLPDAELAEEVGGTTPRRRRAAA